MRRLFTLFYTLLRSAGQRWPLHGVYLRSAGQSCMARTKTQELFCYFYGTFAYFCVFYALCSKARVIALLIHTFSLRRTKVSKGTLLYDLFTHIYAHLAVLRSFGKRPAPGRCSAPSCARGAGRLLATLLRLLPRPWAPRDQTGQSGESGRKRDENGQKRA